MTARPIPPQTKRGPAGFTLVELLTVVAVIALLMAMLAPGLRKATMAAKRTVCLGNLRQLALAWHMYLDDHNGRFLQGVNTTYTYGGQQGQGSVRFGKDPARPVPKPLNTYVDLPTVVRDGAKVFRCPCDEGGAGIAPSHFVYYGTSYRMNHMLVGQNALGVDRRDPCKEVMTEVSQRLANLSRSKLANESKLVLMGDFGWYTQWYFANPSSKRFGWHDQDGYHNLAFMDGHVSFVRVRKGLSTTTDYTLIPFSDLQPAVMASQREVSSD